MVRTALAAACLVCAAGAAAQTLPSGPIVVGDGRLTIGGDVSATGSCAHAAGPGTAACADDAGFFNYTDYEHSALRMFRVDVSAVVKATSHLAVLGELRTENGGWPTPYAFYVRIRPWSARSFDIQAGRVPPTFGAFSRRTYPSENLLIGYPLSYQYLTSLRPDAVPANPDELLRMRGRGWLSNFSIGNTAPARGVPLVSAFRWDTGVQVHAGGEWFDAAAAVTMGTLSNPLVRDDNAGKQVQGRIALRPWTGVVLGGSAATGPFLGDNVRASPGVHPTARFDQSAWGADAEYSRGYYLVRAETVVSLWHLPMVATPQMDWPLRAVGTSVEGRYKILPGLYVAARGEHLGFSQIQGSLRADSWEAPVTRVEVGGGYLLQRNLQLKVSFQRNLRAAGRVTRLNAVAAEAVYWF